MYEVGMLVVMIRGWEWTVVMMMAMELIQEPSLWYLRIYFLPSVVMDIYVRLFEARVERYRIPS